jgi:hypothetical protein
MALVIPSSVNYPSPLFANASRMQDEPKNGRQQIALEFDWGIMGGPANCVSVNVQGNRVNNFEQIATLKVDNSQSGADVVFIWPDVTDTITIPARSPYVLVPVLSNALQFFVVAAQGQVGDITRVQLLNYPVSPSDVPPTVESQTASSGGTVIGSVSSQLIAAGINGTLETMDVSISISTIPAASAQWSMSIHDGATPNKVLVNGLNFAIVAGQSGTAIQVFNRDNLNWRFQNGLVVQITQVLGADNVILNLFADYVQP